MQTANIIIFARFSNLTQSLYARASTPENIQRAKVVAKTVTFPLKVVYHTSGFIGSAFTLALAGTCVIVANDMRKNRPDPRFDLEYDEHGADVYVRSSLARPFTVNDVSVASLTPPTNAEFKAVRLPLLVKSGERLKVGSIRYDQFLGPVNDGKFIFDMNYTFPISKRTNVNFDFKFPATAVA